MQGSDEYVYMRKCEESVLKCFYWAVFVPI